MGGLRELPGGEDRADRLERLSMARIEVDGRLTTVIITEIEPDPFVPTFFLDRGGVGRAAELPTWRPDRGILDRLIIYSCRRSGSGLVGVMHGDRDLHPVGDVELGEQSRHMCFDRRFAQEQ